MICCQQRYAHKQPYSYAYCKLLFYEYRFYLHHGNTTDSKNSTTVVWGKLTVGYFRVKIFCGKIFSSLAVSEENFLTTKYFKVELFVPLLKNLMHNYT